MQIQLVTGVNIRLCFQIDIKYIQILFSPESSSCGGLGMGRVCPHYPTAHKAPEPTVTPLPVGLHVWALPSQDRGACWDSSSSSVIPSLLVKSQFLLQTPLLVVEELEQHHSVHLPGDGVVTGVLFRHRQARRELLGRQLTSKGRGVTVSPGPMLAMEKEDRIAYWSTGAAANQGGESCFLEKPSQIKAHIENIRLSMML